MAAKLPAAVQRLIEQFERLPGVGPKSAQRLVFYLLHNPDNQIQEFSERLLALKKETVLCSLCHNISESDPCALCTDPARDVTQLCVVEQPLDLLALERSDRFHGRYHVLHGAIAPLQHIGPEQLYLTDIVKRLDDVEELILATNATMEGEATALYITELVQQRAPEAIARGLKITRIGHGLPIGADLEYADGVTLARALEGRRQV